MYTNYFFSYIFEKPKGSIECQIIDLTNKVSKLTYHLKKNVKDYASQRGLWKILGKRKRLLAYLFKTNLFSYERLTNQLKIRGFKNR